MSIFNYPSSQLGVTQGGSLMYCTNGTDGYPSLVDFNERMERYVNRKRRTERTAISQADLERIHHLLSDPDALRAEPSASYKTWIKKTFFLQPTPAGTIVCRKEKDPQDVRPIAPKEMMYFVLKEAHAGEGHGGRDKTAKAVKKTHSFVRKGLICLFLETCPTCQARTEAIKKEKITSAQAGSKFLIQNPHQPPPSSSSRPQTLAYQPISHRYSMPFLFGESNTVVDHRNLLPTYPNVQNLQMPLSLAQVPAAPPASHGTTSPRSSSLVDQLLVKRSANALSQQFLLTPQTSSSFGDVEFQHQQGPHSEMGPEFNYHPNNGPTLRLDNHTTNPPPSTEPVEFFDPFNMTSIPSDTGFSFPFTPERLPQNSSSSSFSDPSSMGEYSVNSSRSPMSPPEQLAFKDSQFLLQLLYPNDYTNMSRSTTRHSCF